MLVMIGEYKMLDKYCNVLNLAILHFINVIIISSRLS